MSSARRLISPTEVTLNLSRPDYQIPDLVAGRTGAISSPAAAADTQKLNVWPVGAGPFKITDFVAEDHAYFVKNPDYWDAENINIENFQLSVAPDPATLVAGVQSGSIDFATLPARRRKKRSGRPGRHGQTVARRLTTCPST